MDHPLIDTQAIRELERMVRDLAVRRLKAEMMMDDPEIQEGGPYFGQEGDYAMTKFAFYKCAKCSVRISSKHTLIPIPKVLILPPPPLYRQKPYYGGRKACEAGGGEQEGQGKFNPDDLICPGCSGLAADCKVHGTDFM